MESGLVNYDESPDSPDHACTAANQLNSGCRLEPDVITSLVPQIPDSAVISDVPTPPAPAESLVTSANPVDTVNEMSATVSRDPLISAAMNLVGAELMSEELKVKLEEIRLRAGNDPESAEVERLTLPGRSAVSADLYHLKRRNVFVSPLTMAEFGHPHVLEVMAHCQEFKVSFVQRSEVIASQPSCWDGCMTFRMRTLSDAKEAVLHLQDIRPDLTVRLLKITENVYDVMEKWNRTKTSSDKSTKETDLLLIVNNLPVGATEAKLQQLFPDALEIVVVTTEQSGKCFAYLMFSDKIQVEEAYKVYTLTSLSFDGHLLRIHKYESPKKIPEDFLQLGERFKVLSLLEHFITAYKASSAPCIPMQTQNKMKDAISYLLSHANLDAIARKSLDLPAFSLDELHLLLDKPRSSLDDTVLPVTELLSVFSAEQDRLKESITARKCSGNIGEEGTMHSENSESEPERKDERRKDRTLKTVDSPPARSKLQKPFENRLQGRMRENRLPYSLRRTTSFSSTTAQKRSVLKPLAPSRHSQFSSYSARDEHSRYQTTASRSYPSYQRTFHSWSTGSHRISRPIQTRDHQIRGSRILHSSHRRR